MLGELTFALLGMLLMLTTLRTFLSSLYQLLFGNVPNTTIGVLAFAIFASAALVPVLARVYGPRRTVGITGLVLAVATVLATVSRVAWIDLGLSTVGLIAGLWWLALLHASRPLGRSSPLRVAVPLAIVSDLALRHAFRTVPVVDLALPVAVPLVIAGALVFLAAGLATIADERTWASPGWRGAVGLLALPPLLMVGETGATNAAQVALAGGLGLGPEPARATQLGALLIGVGLAAGAVVLTRELSHRLIGAAGLLFGALLMWLRIPVLSLLGGALFAGGLLIASSALIAGLRPAAGGALTAVALAVGWVLFVAIGFALHAYYMVSALWVAAAAVAVALLVVPATTAEPLVPEGDALAPAARRESGPRMGLGAALLAAALAILVPLTALVPFGSPPVAAARTTLRVMTYNVHQGFDAGQVPSLDALSETIAREDPDVLLLQEVVRGWVIDQQHDVLSVLAERLGMSYVWQGTIGDLYGNAILSKIPMTDVRRVSFTKEPAVRHQQRGALVARIGDIVFVSTHLDENADASDVRQRQMRELLGSSFPGLDPRATPIIVAGDLNALPSSPEVRLLEQAGFSDLALEAGADEPTFPSGKPERRIDYIWGTGLTGAQAHTVASSASDHRAVVVNVTRSDR